MTLNMMSRGRSVLRSCIPSA